jgi:hypothetical protein
MKIPNVDRVDLQQAGRDIFIDVQTKGDIDKVRKAVPPSLEGYKVEVTRLYTTSRKTRKPLPRVSSWRPGISHDRASHTGDSG